VTLFQRILVFWRERTDREKVVVGGGARLVTLLLVYGLMIDPLLERDAKLDRLIVQRQADLERVARLKGDYREAAARVASVDRRTEASGSFSLLSFLEQTATTQQIRDRLSSIRPQPIQALPPYREVSAEVKLENVTLVQVVAYLTAIEAAPQRLRVKYLRLKARFADPAVLDGSFVVATYEKT